MLIFLNYTKNDIFFTTEHIIFVAYSLICDTIFQPF